MLSSRSRSIVPACFVTHGRGFHGAEGGLQIESTGRKAADRSHRLNLVADRIGALDAIGQAPSKRPRSASCFPFRRFIGLLCRPRQGNACYCRLRLFDLLRLCGASGEQQHRRQAKMG